MESGADQQAEIEPGATAPSSLTSLVAPILDPAADPGSALDSLRRLYRVLTDITGLSELGTDAEDVLLPSGKAIAPLDAARCVLDLARTCRFTRGVLRAVELARAQFPDQRIRVLYAGCGPFAPLVLPLATVFSHRDVVLSLIDVNPRSVEAAGRVVDHFRIAGYVHDLQCADACTITLAQEDRPHIVVAETLQRALHKEPQVALARNLAPQILPGGILVPERITVRAALIEPGREFSLAESSSMEAPAPAERPRIELGSLLELDLRSACELASTEDPEELLRTTVEIPSGFTDAHQLALLTEITIIDDCMLREYDSGLTTPMIVGGSDACKAGARLHFRYVMDAEPGFRWQHVD